MHFTNFTFKYPGVTMGVTKKGERGGPPYFTGFREFQPTSISITSHASASFRRKGVRARCFLLLRKFSVYEDLRIFCFEFNQGLSTEGYPVCQSVLPPQMDVKYFFLSEHIYALIPQTLLIPVFYIEFYHFEHLFVFLLCTHPFSAIL